MKRNKLPAGIWRHPVHWLAFGFGSGASPYAPGTLGTLVAIPLFLLLHELSWPLYALVTALMFIAGIWICGWSARQIGVHDHGGIVWDEIVGYLVTMFMLPSSWPWLLAGFALFRLFDIWKPFPIRRLDQGVSGGFGIMLDDVIAGLYALAILHAVMAYLT